MRYVLASLFACCLAFGLTLTVSAEDKKEEPKEVKLVGTITCAKCDLKLEKKCATVIKVEKKVYYFDAAANKKYHADTCQEAKDGTVTGTVAEADKKLTVTVSKLEYK